MKKTLSIFLASSMAFSCSNLKKPKTKTQVKKKTISFSQYKKKAADKKTVIKRMHSKNELFFFTDEVDISTDTYNQTILDVVKNFESADTSYHRNVKELKEQDINSAYKTSSILLFTGSKDKEVLQKYFKKDQSLKNKGAILLGDAIVSDNVLSIVFNVEEASFYAGYLSAKFLSDTSFEFDTPTSPGLKLTAIGGKMDRHSTAYMAGFQKGVYYWNSKAKGQNKKVEFVKLGDSVDQHYTGSYQIGQGQEMATKLTDQKVDVVLSANRGQIIDFLNHVKKVESNMLFVGTEKDLATHYEEHYARFVTSITKDFEGVMKEAVSTIFGDIEYDGMALGSLFIGDVKSGFVSLAENSGNKVSIKEFRKLKDDKEFNKYALENSSPTFEI